MTLMTHREAIYKIKEALSSGLNYQDKISAIEIIIHQIDEKKRK